MIDLGKEIQYKTMRSGGKGGQNVNKVETAVIASWLVKDSILITEEQKEILFSKLSNRISLDGLLSVKSQEHRSQLANKEEAASRLNNIVNAALVKKKSRIATRVSRAAKERRKESKQRDAQVKQARRQIKPGDY